MKPSGTCPDRDGPLHIGSILLLHLLFFCSVFELIWAAGITLFVLLEEVLFFRSSGDG